MLNIQRLHALHAATTQGPWERCQANNGTCQCGLVWSSDLDAVVANCGSDPLVAEEVPQITDEQMVANSAWIAAAHNAWPGVAARIATLEEFAQRVRDAHCDENARIGWQTIEYWSQYAIDWLDAETKKAGV